MTKRTASELWDALDEATLDAEIESSLAKSPEEHRRELVEAGYDLDEVHADADALFATLTARAAETPAATATPAPAAIAAPTAPAPAATATPAPTAPAPAKLRRFRPSVIVPTALALAAGVAVAVQAFSPAELASRAPPDPPAVHAAALRREARAACDARSWKTCVDKLDEARALDPGGDETPEVHTLRHTAAEGAEHP